MPKVKYDNYVRVSSVTGGFFRLNMRQSTTVRYCLEWHDESVGLLCDWSGWLVKPQSCAWRGWLV